MIVDALASEKLQAIRDGTIVGVPLCDIAVPSCKVASHEADRRVEEVETNAHATLVTTQPLQSSLRSALRPRATLPTHLLGCALHSASVDR